MFTQILDYLVTKGATKSKCEYINFIVAHVPERRRIPASTNLRIETNNTSVSLRRGKNIGGSIDGPLLFCRDAGSRSAGDVPFEVFTIA